MNTIIRTLPQVEQAQADAWIYGLIATGIALAFAIAIAFIINWKSNRRDYITRRIWFIIIGLIFPAAYWIYNDQLIAPQIKNPGFRNMFETTNLYVLIVGIILYFLIGIFLMFCFRTSKFGSILGKQKK